MSKYLLVLHNMDRCPDLVDSAHDLAATDPAAQFVLLVPATMIAPIDAVLTPNATPTQFARARAQRMRSEILAAGLRLTATRLGNASLLQALDDALRFADYAAVVIASPPHPLLHRLRCDLACRAAARYPATTVFHAAGGGPPSSRRSALHPRDQRSSVRIQ
jgi:hypothetical protein